MTEEIRRTPLHSTHVAFGGRMVDFAGWSMPMTFAGINEEHVHTRTACSVFDVSHMGRLNVSGKDAQKLLNLLCTRNLTEPEVGRCYYTQFCKEDGGILDDAIVTCFEDHFGVVCNGINRDKIVAWFDKHAAGMDATVKDETLSTAMVAIQGPKALALAAEITGSDFSSLKRYRVTVRDFMSMRLAVYRVGYTGEDGVEVVAPAGIMSMAIPYLLGTPERPHDVIRLAGLGARDTLRIEAAMPLYGHEMTEEIDPLTAGQAWCVDLSVDFIGADAMRKLQAEGLKRQLVGLVLDGKRIARQHNGIYAGDRQVGEITSGTLSPTLGTSIAMGFVETGSHEVDTELEVDLRGKRIAAKVVKLPFYKKPKA